MVRLQLDLMIFFNQSNSMIYVIFPDICWKYNMAQREQTKRFLECVEGGFLTQLVQEHTRGGALLDLLFANREGLMGDVKVGDCLGQSDHEIAEFSILSDARRVTSKTAILTLRRVDSAVQEACSTGPLGVTP